MKEQSYQGESIILYYLPQSTESETYQIGGNLSKGVDWWELVGNLSVSYSDSHSRMQQNGVLQPWHSDIFQTKLELTARPARWMSWDYQLVYACNRLKSESHQSSANYLTQDISVSFRPGSRWRIGISSEHYLNTIVSNHTKSFFLLDADLNYIFSSQCEINFHLSNLLNEKRYAYTMLGELTRNYSEYKIRPLNAVVEFYVKF